MFNNSLLDDEGYLKKVNDVIDSTIDQYVCFPYIRSNLNTIPRKEIQFVIDDQLFFEMLLLNIRGASISYSSYKKKVQNSREKYLIEEINRIEPFHNESEDTKNYIDQLNRELEKLREKRLHGCMVRARVDWVEYGEKPSKFFLNLEKRNKLSRTISHLKDADDHDIYDQDQIQKDVLHFYRQLNSER